MTYNHKIRVTGVLIHEGEILIIKQRVNDSRSWSLPGGTLEAGETLSEGLLREMYEETGLSVRLVKQLYLCEVPENQLVHITFLLETEAIQNLRLPTNEYETVPILDLALVLPERLPEYGFSKKWTKLVTAGFPGTPMYAGHKSTIGL